MREAAPINRRGVLLGACAVAATVALPQVSPTVEQLSAPNYLAKVIAAYPPWDIAVGEELDRWAEMFGLQREWYISHLAHNKAYRQLTTTLSPESDATLRTRIQDEFQRAYVDVEARAWLSRGEAIEFCS